MKRREFLQAGAAATLLAPQRVLGANDRIRVGLIGAGGRGRGVANYAHQAPGAEVVAVSDVYGPALDKALDQFGPKVESYTDYRGLLDCRDIDAVVIGAPDHWHAPMTLDAVAAGKDVYVEKPVTHELAEGEKLVRGVEKSGRVVATGTQQRSWPHFLKAKEVIEQGELGEVHFVRCYWYQNYSRFREWFDKGAPVKRERLDWERWLGPAPKQPFDPVRFRFWRFFWDFGGGIFTDLMTHWIDVIHWYMGDSQPELVQASGAVYEQDWMEAPDTVTGVLQYSKRFMVNYHSAMTGGLLGGGIVFRGSKAMMRLTRQGFAVYPEGVQPFEETSLPEPVLKVERDFAEDDVRARVDGNGTRSNVRNWLESIRSRKRPNAHIRAGVEAARASHLANQAMREMKILRLG